MNSKAGLSLEFAERKQVRRRPNSLNLPEDLRNLLARSIEEGLDSLGGSAGQVILYHIERKHSLKVDDMIDRPESFVQALQDVFGEGAFTLEQIVVETLVRKIPMLREGLQTKRFCRLVHNLKQRTELCLAVG